MESSVDNKYTSPEGQPERLGLLTVRPLLHETTDESPAFVFVNYPRLPKRRMGITALVLDKIITRTAGTAAQLISLFQTSKNAQTNEKISDNGLHLAAHRFNRLMFPGHANKCVPESERMMPRTGNIYKLFRPMVKILINTEKLFVTN